MTQQPDPFSELRGLMARQALAALSDTPSVQPLPGGEEKR